jgi:hypothetical protein
MRTGQALFPLKIEPGISWIRPWNELIVTGAQTTWFTTAIFYRIISYINKDISLINRVFRFFKNNREDIVS